MDPQENGGFALRKRWKLIAIAVAVCIVLIGLFFAWLCMDFHPHKSLEEMGAVSFPAYGDNGMAGNKPGYPFAFLIHEESSAQWNVSTNCGAFLEWRPVTNNDDTLEDIGKDCIVTNGKTLYWTPFKQLYYTDLEHKNHIYIETIIYAESHIVGYCVIQVHRIDSGEIYRAEILDSAYYPPQDGEYQNISESHIRKQIWKAKMFG